MAPPRTNRTAPRSAQLALRGSVGRLWSELHRPAESAGAPLLVFFPDRNHPVLEPYALCEHAGVVVLAAWPETVRDAVGVTEWAAAHAAELDTDPARLLLGGEHAGAALATAVAQHAWEQGWPILLRLLLVDPAGDPEPAVPIPTTVVTAGQLQQRSQ